MFPSTWKTYITAQKARFCRSMLAFFKWAFFGALCGAAAGAVGIGLYWAISGAQQALHMLPWLFWLLPIGGVVIALLYTLAGEKNDRGTNRVLCAARGEGELPLRSGVLVFFGTAITHLLGGSSGREGAALQIGGSIGSWLSRRFRLDKQTARVLVLCGMSAAFSAMFGTPLTAAVFSLEIATVGAVHYVAFWPCAIASLVGFGIRLLTGAPSETLEIAALPSFSWLPLLQTAVVAFAAAAVSQLFCFAMVGTKKLLDRTPFLQNPTLRALVGGGAVVLLTLLLQTNDYQGAGWQVIERAVHEGEAHWYDFLLKMLLTVLTLKFGFKGGEIVPAMFVGATFGCVLGGAIGLSPSLGAAIGLLALFVGVTNCPFAALFLGFELFGISCGWYGLLAVPLAWSISGYGSLYTKQHFLFSKYTLTDDPKPHENE